MTDSPAFVKSGVCFPKFSLPTNSLSVSDEHIQRIQNELQPLKKQILDVEQQVTESKRKLTRSQAEVMAALTPVRSAFRGEPRSRDVTNVLQNSRKQLNQFEEGEAATRPPITQQGHPPARIRQYIKGYFYTFPHTNFHRENEGETKFTHLP